MTGPESADYTRPWTPAPGRFEKILFALFLLVLVGSAVWTVNRGAFLKRPMTDAQVFFRGAWAVCSDAPLFEITDDNGWHYHYPLTLAVVLRPFANAPPRQEPLPWTFSYPTSLFLWFAIGVGALGHAIVKFGDGLDRHALDTPLQHGFFHRWWAMRGGPLLVFLYIVGEGLGRGQVSTLLLLSMAGFAVAYADRRPVAAGLWLSLGIAIKVFPAILVVVPVLRRDWRCIAAIAVGVIAGLIVIPSLLIGPNDTIQLHHQWLTERFASVASAASSSDVGSELSPTSPDMMGFGASILRVANLIHGSSVTAIDTWAMWGHWICSSSLFALVLWAGHGRAWAVAGPQPMCPRALMLFAATITAASVPIVTVSQTHYWTLGIPMYMCVVAELWRRQGRVSFKVWAFGFGGLLWLAAVPLELQRGALSDIPWLTSLMTGLIVYAAFQLFSLTARPASHIRANPGDR